MARAGAGFPVPAQVCCSQCILMQGLFFKFQVTRLMLCCCQQQPLLAVQARPNMVFAQQPRPGASSPLLSPRPSLQPSGATQVGVHGLQQ